MTAQNTEAVKKLAANAAAEFAEEFPGEVLDPAETDWDAEAWAIDRLELPAELRESAEACRLYCETLAAETERLAASEQRKEVA